MPNISHILGFTVFSWQELKVLKKQYFLNDTACENCCNLTLTETGLI
jgi:hypothetical protein